MPNLTVVVVAVVTVVAVVILREPITNLIFRANDVDAMEDV